MKIALLIVNGLAAADHSNPVSTLNFFFACALVGLIAAEVVDYFVAE